MDISNYKNILKTFTCLLIYFMNVCAHSNSGVLLKFQSAVLPPTPFMQRVAKSKGEDITKSKIGTEISAELYKPSGDGPFPIILLFPTCEGWSNMKTNWVEQLLNWGYSVAKIKSIESRPEIGINCDPSRHDGIVGGTDILFDAMGALDYLSKNENIDVTKAVIMGWGLGGSGAVKSVNAQGFARLFERRLKAAVAFYPTCEMHSEYIAASLVVIGDQHSSILPMLCRTMLSNTDEDKKQLFELYILKNTAFKFDQVDEFDPGKAEQVTAKVKAFLDKQIKH